MTMHTRKVRDWKSIIEKMKQDGFEDGPDAFMFNLEQMLETPGLDGDEDAMVVLRGAQIKVTYRAACALGLNEEGEPTAEELDGGSRSMYANFQESFEAHRKVYEEELTPLLEQIKEICRKHEMVFIAALQIGDFTLQTERDGIGVAVNAITGPMSQRLSLAYEAMTGEGAFEALSDMAIRTPNFDVKPNFSDMAKQVEQAVETKAQAVVAGQEDFNNCGCPFCEKVNFRVGEIRFQKMGEGIMSDIENDIT